MNSLGNILNNNNINNPKVNTVNTSKNINNNMYEDNKKQMILTNSSINFQTGTGINQISTNNSNNMGNNKENLNFQNLQMDPFKNLKNRTSFDLNSLKDNTNNTLMRVNSTLTQNRIQNQNFNLYSNNEIAFKQNENELEGSQNNITANMNMKDGNEANANQLFNELNLLYNNNSNNSISGIPERDDKELNKLKENYYNISNKLKMEQRVFSKEGYNSLCGILQILKIVNNKSLIKYCLKF